MNICHRCGKLTRGTICSFFNTEQICFDCSFTEMAHPNFTLARDAEIEAVRSGNFNFKGIGLPEDLKDGNSAKHQI